MSSKPVIITRNLSKKYIIYPNPLDRIWRLMFGKGKKTYQEFCALAGINLEIFPGETVGIVGRNGAGKSTLLKIICGLLTATDGEIIVNGRITPLLAIGAGFNPDFTGRENVILNASVLGLSQGEIQDCFAQIEEFADIGEFIDRPVRYYSSGMYSRLAFAIAIHTKPQILVVDEILAVGDQGFARKCFARIEQMKSEGKTILFVSHSTATMLEICDRAVLIDQGKHLLTASAKTVICQYNRLINASPSEKKEILAEIKYLQETSENKNHNESEFDQLQIQKGLTKDLAELNSKIKNESEIIYETKGAFISEVKILDQEEKLVHYLQKKRPYTITYQVKFDQSFEGVKLALTIITFHGIQLGGALYPQKNNQGLNVDSKSVLELKFNFDCSLQPGKYFISVAVVDKKNEFLHARMDTLMFEVISNSDNEKNLGFIDFDFETILNKQN